MLESIIKYDTFPTIAIKIDLSKCEQTSLKKI